MHNKDFEVHAGELIQILQVVMVMVKKNHNNHYSCHYSVSVVIVWSTRTLSSPPDATAIRKISLQH